ncbi:MAG: hypothetical protein ACLP4V_05635 [Methylocella sp.]
MSGARKTRQSDERPRAGTEPWNLSPEGLQAWRRELAEEQRLAPWRQAVWSIEEGKTEALCELARLLREGDAVPDFVMPILAELIDPQFDTLDIKLVPKRTEAFARLKGKEIKERQTAEQIEAEIEQTKCSLDAAIGKITPGQKRTAERILKRVRHKRVQIKKLLGRFAPTDKKSS